MQGKQLKSGAVVDVERIHRAITRTWGNSGLCSLILFGSSVMDPKFKIEKTRFLLCFKKNKKVLVPPNDVDVLAVYHQYGFSTGAREIVDKYPWLAKEQESSEKMEHGQDVVMRYQKHIPDGYGGILEDAIRQEKLHMFRCLKDEFFARLDSNEKQAVHVRKVGRLLFGEQIFPMDKV